MNTTILNMFVGGADGFIFIGDSWGPVIDGTLVLAHPTDAGVKVPSIMGSTAQEATLFVQVIYGNTSASLNETDYDLSLVGNFGSLAATVNATYPLITVRQYDNACLLRNRRARYPLRCPLYHVPRPAEQREQGACLRLPLQPHEQLHVAALRSPGRCAGVGPRAYS